MSKIADKTANFKAKSDDELSADLSNLKREAFNLRFQAATNQLEKPSRVREVRRDIARLKTVASQKRAGAAAPAEKPASTTKPAAKRAAKPKRAARSKAKAE